MEKKYKLLKDLPNCNAGKVITIANLNNPHANFEDDCGSLITVFWKDPIWFEEVKEPEFKVGDWITRMNGAWSDIVGAVQRITDCKIDKENQWSYFEWSTKDDKELTHSWDIKDIRLATPEEIKAHLIKEAEKRGIKKDATLAKTGINAHWSMTLHSLSGRFTYHPNGDILDADGNGHAYNNGKWAEIIKEKEKIMIGEYEVKFDKDHKAIHVGCKTYSYNEVKDLLAMMYRLNIEYININANIISQDLIVNIFNGTLK